LTPTDGSNSKLVLHTCEFERPRERPGGRGSFKALLFRALKLPIPPGDTRGRSNLDFFECRVQVRDQIVRVLDAD
jgi:hypothetical protein